MAVHKPGAIWPLRSPEYGACVRTADRESLWLDLIEPDTITAVTVNISRKDARLLAKRINACLDATTSKGN